MKHLDHPDFRLMTFGDVLDKQVAALKPIIAAVGRTGSTAGNEAAFEGALDERDATVHAILAEPATTIEGVMVKLRALCALYHEGLTAETIEFANGDSTDQRLARSVLFSLMQIGNVQ